MADEKPIATIEAKTNIGDLQDLLYKANVKANELEKLVEKINNFEVEINLNQNPKVIIK